MIVAAAERRPYLADDAKRAPIEPNFRKRGAHQVADEDQVAAALGAKQSCRPPHLTDRDPVMTETLDPLRVADSPEREQHGIDAALAKRIRDREGHHAAGCDQSDG